MQTSTLIFEKRCYDIAPTMPVLLDMEDELGSLASFHERLEGNGWRLAELVTAIQILLQSAGRQVDFMELGNRMIAEGLAMYRSILCQFLYTALEHREEKAA